VTKHLGERASFFTNLEGIGFVGFERISTVELMETDAADIETILRDYGLVHISSWPRVNWEQFRDVLDAMIDEGWHVGKFTYAFVWDTRVDPSHGGVPTTLWAFENLSTATRMSLNFDSRTVAQ
jgi:hypothetical protein